MLLSEERAEQLLDEWTRDCGQILLALPSVSSGDKPVASRLVLMNDFHFRDDALAAAHGDALRRAMEGLNALAYCAGFSVQENPVFWRRQLRKLSAVDSTVQSFLSSDMFTRYCIRLELLQRTNSTAVACALATCVDMGNGNVRGARIRETVSEMLGGYLCKSPPSLEVEIDLIPVRANPNNDCRWMTFGDSLAKIDHIWALEGALEMHPVVVVLGHEFNPIWFSGERLKNAVDLVKSSGTLIHLRELHCEIPGSHHDWSIYQSVADLMTCLVRIDTVESLSLKLDKWDDRLSSMACSALPDMRSLAALKLFPALPDIHWLAYALQSRQRRGLSPLSLHVKLLPGTCTQLQAAMAMANCVSVHVPPIIQVRINPIILPVGMTVAVQQHAELMQDLF